MHQATIVQLKDADHPGQQQAALSELIDQLSVSSEDQLAALPTDQIVPVLTSLMQSHVEHVVMQAAQAMNFVAEGGPSACRAIVKHGGLGALRMCVQHVVFIDVAETAITVRGPGRAG